MVMRFLRKSSHITLQESWHCDLHESGRSHIAENGDLARLRSGAASKRAMRLISVRRAGVSGKYLEYERAIAKDDEGRRRRWVGHGGVEERTSGRGTVAWRPSNGVN